MNKQRTHNELCEIGRRWLLMPNSKHGHGCHVANTELFTGWGCEQPDAVGVRMAGHNDGSIVIEAKTSRSDFLADLKKPHRASGQGIGRWRYYLCPEGLIAEDELPARWGLLYVTHRGGVRPIAGPARVLADRGGYEAFNAACEDFSNTSDLQREVFMLTHLLARVQDAEQVNRQIRAFRNRAQNAEAQLQTAQETIKQLENALYEKNYPYGPPVAIPRARRASSIQPTTAGPELHAVAPR